MAYPLDDLDDEQALLAGMDDSSDAISSSEAAPSNTVASAPTTSDMVKQRIAEMRGVGPSPEEAAKYAQSSSQTAGFGRAINALASATGYKADNSAYDAMEKGGREVAEKAFDRSAQVQKYIAANDLRKQQMAETATGHKNTNAVANRNAAAKEAMVAAFKERTAKLGGNADKRLDAGNIRTANGIFKDPSITKEVNKLNASRSAQTLIDEIKSGHIVDSKNIRNQLSTIMSTIEMGGPGAHADRAAMGVDNLYTKVKDALSFFESNPNSTIPKQYLDQLESEANALGDRAATNYHNLSKAALASADLSGGNPDVDPGKVYGLGKQKRDLLLKSNGYDPETGMPVGRAEKHSGNGSGGLIPNANAAPVAPGVDDFKALKWAKSNPSDPRAKEIISNLKAMGIR